MSRLIIANLTCEIELARSAYRQAVHPTVHQSIASWISAAALKLTVFAEPGDMLWTPAEVPIDAHGRVPGSESLNLITGSLTSLIGADVPILAWGETDRVARLRGKEESSIGRDPVELGTTASDAADRAARTPPRPPKDWAKRLWRVHPSAQAALDCNHRGFAYAFARRRGLALPNAAILTSVEEVDRHLASGGAAPSKEGRWVLKAPYSASGRERILRRGPLTDDVRVFAERLFARYRSMIFEPWLDRIADFGTAGFIDRDGSVGVFPPHCLESDNSGVFRAIIVADDEWALWMSKDERESAIATAAAVGEALAEVGFRGPFTIDSYAYRDRAGRRHFHPLCEINARLSFGHLARAWAEKLDQSHYELRLDRS